MTLKRTLCYAAGTMMTVLTVVAAADAKPFSHGHAGGSGPNLGQIPFTGAAFVCNYAGPPIPGDAFAGYVNISTVKRLVYNLQTSSGGHSSTGISDVTVYPNHPATFKFKSVEFDLSGTADPCFGPWVFVTTVDKHGNELGIYQANVINGTPEPTRTTGFTTLQFTPATFGLPSNQLVGNVVVQLFPDTSGQGQVNNDYINNFTLNGCLQTPAPRTLYDYCPLGYFDPRTGTSCGSGPT